MELYYIIGRKGSGEEGKGRIRRKRKESQIPGPETILGAFTYIISFVLHKKKTYRGEYYHPILLKKFWS